MSTVIVVNAGSRMHLPGNPGRGVRTWKHDGVKHVRVWNKLLRRQQRGRAMFRKSRVGRELVQCREDDLEVARLATNSHQRRRAIAADRLERRLNAGRGVIEWTANRKTIKAARRRRK